MKSLSKMDPQPPVAHLVYNYLCSVSPRLADKFKSRTRLETYPSKTASVLDLCRRHNEIITNASQVPRTWGQKKKRKVNMEQNKETVVSKPKTYSSSSDSSIDNEPKIPIKPTALTKSSPTVKPIPRKNSNESSSNESQKFTAHVTSPAKPKDKMQLQMSHIISTSKPVQMQCESSVSTREEEINKSPLKTVMSQKTKKGKAPPDPKYSGDSSDSDITDNVISRVLSKPRESAKKSSTSDCSDSNDKPNKKPNVKYVSNVNAIESKLVTTKIKTSNSEQREQKKQLFSCSDSSSGEEKKKPHLKTVRSQETKLAKSNLDPKSSDDLSDRDITRKSAKKSYTSDSSDCSDIKPISIKSLSTNVSTVNVTESEVVVPKTETNITESSINEDLRIETVKEQRSLKKLREKITTKQDSCDGNYKKTKNNKVKNTFSSAKKTKQKIIKEQSSDSSANDESTVVIKEKPISSHVTVSSDTLNNVESYDVSVSEQDVNITSRIVDIHNVAFITPSKRNSSCDLTSEGSEHSEPFKILKNRSKHVTDKEIKIKSENEQEIPGQNISQTISEKHLLNSMTSSPFKVPIDMDVVQSITENMKQDKQLSTIRSNQKNTHTDNTRMNSGSKEKKSYTDIVLLQSQSEQSDEDTENEHLSSQKTTPEERTKSPEFTSIQQQNMSLLSEISPLLKINDNSSKNKQKPTSLSIETRIAFESDLEDLEKKLYFKSNENTPQGNTELLSQSPIISKPALDGSESHQTSIDQTQNDNIDKTDTPRKVSTLKSDLLKSLQKHSHKKDNLENEPLVPDYTKSDNSSDGDMIENNQVAKSQTDEIKTSMRVKSLSICDTQSPRTSLDASEDVAETDPIDNKIPDMLLSNTIVKSPISVQSPEKSTTMPSSLQNSPVTDRKRKRVNSEYKNNVENNINKVVTEVDGGCKKSNPKKKSSTSQIDELNYLKNENVSEQNSKSKSRKSEAKEELNGYKCILCDFKTRTRRSLGRHLIEHIDEEQFKCKIKKGTLTPDSERQCDMCPFSTTKSRYFKDHYNRVHAATKYDCQICEKKFTQLADFNKHTSTHEVIACEYCGEEFQVGSLKTHMKVHTKDDKKCSMCETEFTKKRYLVAHMKVHTEDSIDIKETKSPRKSQYECDYCEQVLSTKKEYKKHVKRTHREELECHICNNIFINKSKLSAHLQTHTQGFKCHLCDYVGKFKYYVTKHMRVHSKLLECEYCDRSFGEQSHLNTHLSHHTSSDYKCKTCNKMFVTKIELKVHSGKHKTEKECNTGEISSESEKKIENVNIILNMDDVCENANVSVKSDDQEKSSQSKKDEVKQVLDLNDIVLTVKTKKRKSKETEDRRENKKKKQKREQTTRSSD